MVKSSLFGHFKMWRMLNRHISFLKRYLKGKRKLSQKSTLNAEKPDGYTDIIQ